MATVFTSWTDLHRAMLDAAAGFFAGESGVQSFEFSGSGNSRKMVFRTIAEFKEGLAFVKEMADTENPSAAAPGRTYATNGRYNG